MQPLLQTLETLEPSAGVDGFVVGLPVTRQGNIRRRETDSVQVISHAVHYHTLSSNAWFFSHVQLCAQGLLDNAMLVNPGDQEQYNLLLCLSNFQTMPFNRLHTSFMFQLGTNGPASSLL